MIYAHERSLDFNFIINLLYMHLNVGLQAKSYRKSGSPSPFPVTNLQRG